MQNLPLFSVNILLFNFVADLFSTAPNINIIFDFIFLRYTEFTQILPLWDQSSSSALKCGSDKSRKSNRNGKNTFLFMLVINLEK